MTWVFHDSYKTEKLAEKEGKIILGVGLAKGIKIVSKGKKLRPYLLYILSIKERKMT